MSQAVFAALTGGDIDRLSAICTRKTGRELLLLLLEEEVSCEGPLAVKERGSLESWPECEEP